MKKNTLRLIVLICVILVTSCTAGGNRADDLNDSNDFSEADNRIEQILDLIQNEDKEGMKDIFSQQVIDEVEDLETDIDYIVEFFHGDVSSWEDAGVSVGESKEQDNKNKQVRSFYNVETDKESYIVFILEITEDTKTPDNIGVYTLRIIRAEDEDTQFTYWQDMAIPGIYNPTDQLKENHSIKYVDDEVENEVKDTLSNKWYTKANNYCIAPSEFTNNDMVRPEDNTEWIKSLAIKYPRIYDLQDYEKEERLNDMIFKEVIYYHDIMENRDYIEYSVDYKIMEANDELISILFLGEVDDNHTSNRFAYAITIDIESEKKLELAKFFLIDKSFIKDYLYTKFEIVENNFENVSENTPFIQSFIESYSLFDHKNDFYIMGDDIGIIVPTYNSMGYIMIQGEMD